VALAAHKRKRRVVLSVPNFLMLPEVIARSDLVALAPERIVRDRADRLQLLAPPIPVPGFTMALAWHDRTHTNAAQAWFRARLAAAGSDAKLG
jgi:DNA-binding transcriptional LysR family regulator